MKFCSFDLLPRAFMTLTSGVDDASPPAIGGATRSMGVLRASRNGRGRAEFLGCPPVDNLPA